MTIQLYMKIFLVLSAVVEVWIRGSSSDPDPAGSDMSGSGMDPYPAG